MRRWFLSYHSPEQTLAERLKAAIERQDADSRVFFSATSLRAGAYWQPALAKEIDEADAFVLLVGERGLGPWQALEYYAAHEKHVKAPEFPVVLILLDGHRAPGLPFLRQLNWIVTADPASEKSVARLIDAAAGADTRPGELWRYTSPYRGLSAMEEKDADYFFGRARETVEVLGVLSAESDRLPVLLGNSGVGKSSLAQAGVLAALRRQAWPECASPSDAWPAAFKDSRAWCFLSLKPGTDPLNALVENFLRAWQLDPTRPAWGQRRAEWVSALAAETSSLRDLLDATERRFEELHLSPPPMFLLYVDQGEELYVRAEDRQRRRFSELIAHGLSDRRLHAIMSLRADFLGALQNDEPLYAVHRQINVPPLREPELREVVSRPSVLLSARFETNALAVDIARRAAEESAKDAGALPLLSYLLDDMWTQMVTRGDGVLRLPAQAIELGGVLADRANAFLARNPNAEQAVRGLMTVKLATVLEDGDPTRRRALRSEFTEEEWRLVSELADHPNRLVITATPDEGETYAEVAHEAIFRRWDKLREWIVAEREFLIWRSGLEAARRQWERAPEESKNDALLMGWPLARAVDWLTKRPYDLNEPTRAFISFSIDADNKRQAQSRELRDQALGMQSRYLADLASQSCARGSYVNAIALALEALPDERRGIIRPYIASAESVLYHSVLRLHEHYLEGAGGLSRADRQANRQKARSIFRPEDRLVLKQPSRGAAHDEGVTFVCFSQNGQLVLACGIATAWVWDAEGGNLITALSGHTAKINRAVFSPSGGRVVTASDDGTARLWDAASGRELAMLSGHTDMVKFVAFSPNEEQILTASCDRTARLWDARTGAMLLTLARDSDQAVGEIPRVSAAFNVDGSRVAAAWGSTIQIWDANTGARLVILSGHKGWVRSIAFNPDDRRLVTASEDNTARVWDVETGTELMVLTGHTQPVNTAEFSRDQQRLVTGSGDMTARIWDSKSGNVVNVLRGHHGSIRSALFSSDRRRVFTAAGDNTSRIWDLLNGAEIAVMRGHRAALSPDERRMVTACKYSAEVWPVFSNTQELIDRARNIEQVLEIKFGLSADQGRTI